MDRRTWIGSALATVLGWFGWEQSFIQEGPFEPHIHDMVVSKDPIIIYCLEPPQVKVYNAYLEQVCRYLEKDFTRVPYVPPHEGFMRTIENAVADHGIHEACVDDFRRHIMTFVGQQVWRGKPHDFEHTVPSLKEAIEKVCAKGKVDDLLPLPDLAFAMPDPASYDGFPVRYPHWKWGEEYEELNRGHPNA
jgi:hypothetical protein